MKQKWGVAGFAAGLLLTLGAILFSVLAPALSESRFERALLANVDAAAGISEQELSRFASDTIGYIGGAASEWSPRVSVGGAPMPVPAAFTAHMARVRAGVALAKGLCVGCFALGLALLVLCAVRARRGSRFPRCAYLWGVALPLCGTLALCAWAAIDFGGFWGWLHYTFIPDGVFAFDEPIMRLFPLSLFADYIAPVAALLALSLCAVGAPALADRLKGKEKP